MNRVIFGALLCVVVSIVGCSESDPLGRLAVSGNITLAGKPLETGNIAFEPVSKGVSAGAPIKNGSFSVSAEIGLPPGTYIVRISSPVGGAETPEAPGESNVLAIEQIPEEFNANSKQKIEVVKNGKNTFDFDIPKVGN